MAILPASLILGLIYFLFVRRKQASDELFFSELESKPSESIKNKTQSFINKLYNYIINPNNIKFTTFRDLLYDIFIYDMDIGYILWNIIQKVLSNNELPQDKIDEIYIEVYSFLQLYNNNYRPIYHLERYFFNLINKVHGF